MLFQRSKAHVGNNGKVESIQCFANLTFIWNRIKQIRCPYAFYTNMLYLLFLTNNKIRNVAYTQLLQNNSWKR